MFNSCKVVIIFFILMVSINDFAVIKYREIRCWSPLGLKELRELYTAISIYVVGSKLQGYGTRPKGGMGRLELILGFRGCRREMDMDIGDLRCMDEALLILLIIIH